MKIYHLEFKQQLNVRRPDCWAFFSDPGNLQKITPPELGFSIKSELPERMYAGQIIIYKIKVFPMIRYTWVTEITQVNEPAFFIDEQRSGPYKFWHHQHLFKENGAGTEMTDIVHYAVPFGLIGRFVNRIIIRKKLMRIFSFRQDYLNNLFPENRIHKG